MTQGHEVARTCVVPRKCNTRVEHHDRCGTAGRTPRVVGPRENRTEGLGRIGGCKNDRRHGFVGVQFDIHRVAETPQSVDRTGQRELRGTKTIDEVATANMATFLEHLQHPVHPRKTTRHRFGEYRLACQDAVALQQLLGDGVQLGGSDTLVGHDGRFECTPAARSGRWAHPRQAHRTRSTGGALTATAGATARSTEQRAQRSERVVRDLTRPHQIPQCTESFRVGCSGCRGDDAVPETRTALFEHRANCIVQRTDGRFGPLEGRQQVIDLVGEEKSHAAVVRADRSGTQPHDLTAGEECVEVGRAIAAHTLGQHVGFECRCHDRRALQHLNDVDERIGPAALARQPTRRRGIRTRNAVPCRQEAREHLLLDRLDLAPQRGERASSDLSQHLDVAPFAFDAVGPERAEHHTTFGLECPQHSGDAIGGNTQPARDCGHEEWRVRTREPRDDRLEWTRDGLGEVARQAHRQGTSECVAVESCVLGRDESLFAGDRHRNDAPFSDEAFDGSVETRFTTHRHFETRQIADAPEDIVQLVVVARTATVGQALGRQFHVGDRTGVEEFTQFLGAEQFVQQVAVE